MQLLRRTVKTRPTDRKPQKPKSKIFPQKMFSKTVLLTLPQTLIHEHVNFLKVTLTLLGWLDRKFPLAFPD